MFKFTHSLLSPQSLQLFIVLFATAHSAVGQRNMRNAPPEFPTVKWETILHDYGNVKAGIPYTYEFTFENTGTGDIYLDNVRTNCQCITPYWDNDPIEPNEKGSIYIVFMAKKSGIFKKGILVSFKHFRKPSVIEVAAHTDDIPKDLLVIKTVEQPTDMPSTNFGQPSVSANNSGRRARNARSSAGGASVSNAPNAPGVPGNPHRRRKSSAKPKPAPKELPSVFDNNDNTNNAPADDFPYMTKRERAMIDEINLVRSNPKGYIPFVEDYVNHLRSEIDGGSPMSKFYQDEIKAALELINELQNTSPLSQLKPHEGVYVAAKNHGKDMITSGNFGHVGSDGSFPWDRVLKYANDLSDGNENLVGGPYEIRQAILILLIDAGIPDRGHRKTLLNPNWNFVACYEVGKINDIPNCWVQNFGKK